MASFSLSHITAEALVPEQLVHYVRAISGRRAFLCHGLPAFVHDGDAVVADFARTDAAEPETAPGAEPARRAAPLDALRELAASCRRVTLLSSYAPLSVSLPELSPDGAPSTDWYWQLPLPGPGPGTKLRSLLKRAGREVSVTPEPWGADHSALVRSYLETRPLSPGTRALFTAAQTYVESGGRDALNIRLATARRTDGENAGALAGFAVGDFNGLSTAFYMFAFREREAPPGTADLLLRDLLEHGTSLGQSRMNLGLGVNPGIAFFKKKWGATPFLPYVETRWTVSGKGRSAKKGLLSRLFGG